MSEVNAEKQKCVLDCLRNIANVRYELLNALQKPQEKQLTEEQQSYNNAINFSIATIDKYFRP